MSTPNMIDAARRYLDQARDALGARHRDMRQRLDELARLDSSLRNTAASVRADERLTPTAKRADLHTAAREYREAAQQVITELHQTVNDTTADLRHKLTLPALDGDDAQGRLANARADALMVLDRTPDDRLAQALETLARDSGDIGHLMLSGFAERYLQARQHNSTAAQWQTARDTILAERLGDGAKATLARLDGLQHARNATTLTEHHVHHAANDATEGSA